MKDNASEIGKLGHLEKSIGIRIRTYGGTLVAIIGPRTQKTWVIGSRIRGKHAGQQIIIAPSRIAHFFERGTKRTRLQKFVEPAKQSTEGQFLETLANEIRTRIEALLK